MADGREDGAGADEGAAFPPPPSLWRRFGCLAADEAILAVVMTPVVFLFPFSASGYADLRLTAALIMLVYTAVMHAWRGQTLGKMLGRIKVVKLDGTDITVFQAVTRAFFHHGVGIMFFWIYLTAREQAGFVLLLPNLYFCIDAGFALADRDERRSLHDTIAGTRVAKVDGAREGEAGKGG